MPWRARADGLTLSVRVQAGARRAGITGVTEIDGRRALAVRVRAPAQDGKANTAAAEMLAECCGLRPRAVMLTAGARGRLKTFQLSGDATTLAARLNAATGAAEASAPSGESGGGTP